MIQADLVVDFKFNPTSARIDVWINSEGKSNYLIFNILYNFNTNPDLIKIQIWRQIWYNLRITQFQNSISGYSK